MNPIKETWINPKVEIKETLDKGKGMFAGTEIYEGEKVVIWGGSSVNSMGAEKASREGKLVMQWDDDLYSVEERGDDPGYYINHSCDSNLWMIDAFTLVARRNIKIGKELTADYALWEADPSYISKWECLCGSKFCRKKITGNDWKLKDIQKKYYGHFSPLINKKILDTKN
jgi:uncharacterized protein